MRIIRVDFTMMKALAIEKKGNVTHCHWFPIKWDYENGYYELILT